MSAHPPEIRLKTGGFFGSDGVEVVLKCKIFASVKPPTATSALLLVVAVDEVTGKVISMHMSLLLDEVAWLTLLVEFEVKLCEVWAEDVVSLLSRSRLLERRPRAVVY